MTCCGVIPIRLDSKRFPGKGLAKLAGKEIILHTWERAKQYQGFSKLLVATDSAEIKNLIEARGGEVYFSDQRFRNGSERVAAACAALECEICVNVQGDEVFVTPESIAAAVELLEKRPEFAVTTAVFPIPADVDPADPNLVKAVLHEDGTVYGFSRTIFSGTPSTEHPENYGHIGIYAFRKDFLLKYPTLPESDGERQESLEQLRVLEHGYRIGAVIVQQPLLAINSPADLEAAEKQLAMIGGPS
ncbi:MAG: 3-deoxy-manno-octulosonate cytidylyltransferase [bacterium]